MHARIAAITSPAAPMARRSWEMRLVSSTTPVAGQEIHVNTPTCLLTSGFESTDSIRRFSDCSTLLQPEHLLHQELQAHGNVNRLRGKHFYPLHLRRLFEKVFKLKLNRDLLAVNVRNASASFDGARLPASHTLHLERVLVPVVGLDLEHRVAQRELGLYKHDVVNIALVSINAARTYNIVRMASRQPSLGRQTSRGSSRAVLFYLFL